MGAKVSKKRNIFVTKPLQRVTKLEQARLKAAYEQWQNQDGLLTINMFSQECLGTQIPETISYKLYVLFASETIVRANTNQNSNQLPIASNQTFMNFNDLLAFYAVMKNPMMAEQAQVAFEIVCDLNKLKYDADYHVMQPDAVKMISFQDMNIYILTVGLNPDHVTKFYEVARVSNMNPLKLEDFTVIWPVVKGLPLFSWVQMLSKNNVTDVQNIDEDGKGGLDRRLTTIHMHKSLSQSITSGKLTEQETEQICQFFTEEVQGADAKQIITLFSLMYRQIANKKLYTYLLNYSCNRSGGVSLEFLTNLVSQFINQKSKISDLEFLFDVFTNGRIYMNKKVQKDFLESFKLRLGLLGTQAQLNREDFVDILKQESIDDEIQSVKQARFMIKAMMALPVDDHAEQKDVILAALNDNRNLDLFIYENLLEMRTFYAIEEEFWSKWCHSIGFQDTQLSFALKDMPKETIQNRQLLEKFHDQRLKDTVAYKSEYVVVPKYVYKPLQMWYGVDQTITRNVIVYKTKEPALPSSRHGTRSSMFGSSTGFYSANLILQHQNSQSGNNSSNMFQGMSKRIGNTVYELEIEPKVIYIGIIDEKGQKPNAKQLTSSNRVDVTFINKHLKSKDKLPFEEYEFSRRTTLQEILEQVAAKQDKNWKNTRLLLSDQPVNRNKLKQTLEDLQIETGQILYIEFANESNQWPSEKTPKLKKQPSGTNFGPRNKTSGLINLGNTCYLNSALQCLVNNPMLYEYFVKQKKHENQKNLRSKFAFQGDLVDGFATLTQQMWDNDSLYVVPKDFKDMISTLSEQFQGYDQQDSQEFLAFLLDGLHEELNLRQQKPYIQNPDSNNRPTVELGLESWSNSLRREWSFIFFLFYGQLKSTLTCKTCQTQSITFDLFSNIPLPLPEPASRIINVIIYRLPNKIKDILNGKISSTGGIGFSDSESDINSRVQSARSGRVHTKLTEKINYMTNDQPIRVSVKVPSDCRLSEVKKRILQFREVNVCLRKQTNICFYMNAGQTINILVHQDIRLNQVFQISNEINCIEHLTQQGKKSIREFYMANEDFFENDQSALLTNLCSINTIKHEQDGERFRKQYRENILSKNKQLPGMDFYNIFNSSNNVMYQHKLRFQQKILNLATTIFIVVYHRRFVRKEHYFMTRNAPQLLGSPILLEINVQSSGKRIYDEIWSIAHKMLQTDSPMHFKKNRWWEKPDAKNKLKKSDASFKPFVVKVVDKTGLHCGECPWTNNCTGCVVAPGETLYNAMVTCPTMAIEWHSTLIEESYNPKANEIIQHQSVQDLKDGDEETPLNLEDCFTKFNSVESLENDSYCKKCANHTSHTKQIDIFQPPPILIIQLKRFKVIGQVEVKMSHVIEFPIFNLDLNQFMTDQNFLFDQGIISNYDLTGLVLHFGSINFGHYISVVKNHFDNKWYKYDDQQRQEISQDSIAKENAYILFYMRRDITKKTISDIFPSFTKFFAGKPIFTDKGDGFVIPDQNMKSGSGKVMVKMKDEEAPQLMDVKSILPENDKDELVYTKAELEEIKKQKIDKQKRRQSMMNQSDDIHNHKVVKSSGICSCLSKKPTSKHTMQDGFRRNNAKVEQQPLSQNESPSRSAQSETENDQTYQNDGTGNQYDQETSGNNIEDSTPIKLNQSDSKINESNKHRREEYSLENEEPLHNSMVMGNSLSKNKYSSSISRTRLNARLDSITRHSINADENDKRQDLQTLDF